MQPTPTPTPTVVAPTYAPKRLVVDLRANAKASRTSTLFKDLSLRSVPAGATVSATCAKGCKRPSLTFKNVAGTVSLKAFFAKRAKQGTLKAGTKIREVVSATEHDRLRAKPSVRGAHGAHGRYAVPAARRDSSAETLSAA